MNTFYDITTKPTSEAQVGCFIRQAARSWLLQLLPSPANE